DLADLIPSAPPDALDLLRKMLAFNPAKRISAQEALAHPYLDQFHNEDEEPARDSPIEIIIADDEKMSVSVYRDRLYSEIVKRKKEIRNRALKKRREKHRKEGREEAEAEEDE
ncbi:hypothetical protein KIPB_013294, partial [Kipferlia bialata]